MKKAFEKRFNGMPIKSKTNDNFLVIQERLDTAIVVTFCALILFLPVSIALVESLSGLAIFLFLIKKFIESRNACFFKSGRLNLSVDCWRTFAGKIFEQKTFLHRPLFILIGVILLSVIFSQYRVTSCVAFFGKTLQGMFLYLSFTDVFTKRWHVKLFSGVFMATSFIVAISAIIQYFTGVDFLRGLPLLAGRASACFRHPNDLGAFLVLAISLWIGVLLCIKNKAGKVLFYALFGVVLLAFMLTFSRGAWLGFLCTLILFAVLKPRILWHVLALSVLIMFIFVPQLIQKRNINFIADNLKTKTMPHWADQDRVDNVGRWKMGNTELNPKDPADFMQTNSLVSEYFLDMIRYFGGSGRAEYWAKAINIIDTAPFLGTGLNTYSIVSQRYPSFWGGGYPHNCYLQMTAETGLLGLLVFLWFIMALFGRSINCFRKSKDETISLIGVGALCGVAGFLIQAFFDTTLYSVQLGNLLWVMIAFIVAMAQMERSTAVIDKK